LLALTFAPQLSLSQPQVDCITAYIRSTVHSQAAQRRGRILLIAAAAAGVVAALSAALMRLNRRQ
jgi:hypothetical protein